MRRYMSVKRLGALVLAAVISVSAAFVSEAARLRIRLRCLLPCIWMLQQKDHDL